MSRPYHILVGINIESTDNEFEYIFGDYSRLVVAEEKIDVSDSEEYRRLKIITLNSDDQSAIEEQMKLLNNK